MLKKKEKQKPQQENSEVSIEEKYEFLKQKTIKQLIAPAGIDASNIDHLEIISDTTRFARSFFVVQILSLLNPFSSSPSICIPLSGTNPFSAGLSARNITRIINATTNTAINGTKPPREPIAA